MIITIIGYSLKKKKKLKVSGLRKFFKLTTVQDMRGQARVHVDGKSYWESTTSAPLPRREYSKRKDYNVTIRGNRHEITKTGWVHDQNNMKVIRESGKADIILAHEKGFNNYMRVNDDKCKAASEWWTKQIKWEIVRNKRMKFMAEIKT